MARIAGTHAREPFASAGFVSTNPDTRMQAATRSLLMGNRLFLKLTRLVRSRRTAEGTADDAVLTLTILSTETCLTPGGGLAAVPGYFSA